MQHRLYVATHTCNTVDIYMRYINYVVIKVCKLCCYYFRHTHNLPTGRIQDYMFTTIFLFLWSTFVVTDSLHIYAVMSFAVHKIPLVFCWSDDSNMGCINDTDCTWKIGDLV